MLSTFSDTTHRRSGFDTYAEQNDRVHPRPRALLDTKDSRRERHLLVLPKYIDAKADNDNSSDVDSACACLNCLEDEKSDC